MNILTKTIRPGYSEITKNLIEYKYKALHDTIRIVQLKLCTFVDFTRVNLPANRIRRLR